MNSEQHVFGHGTRLEAAPTGVQTGISQRIDEYLFGFPDSTARQIADALGEEVTAVQSSLKVKKAAGEVAVSGAVHGPGGIALLYSLPAEGEADAEKPKPMSAEAKIRAYLADHPGKTMQQLADALGVNRSAVQKALEVMSRKNEVTVAGKLRQPKKPPQNLYRLWDGEKDMQTQEPPQPIPAPVPQPVPQPASQARLTPRLAQSLDEVRRKLRRNDTPIQPQSIAVLRELEKILDPSIAEVLEQIRKHLEEAA